MLCRCDNRNNAHIFQKNFIYKRLLAVVYVLVSRYYLLSVYVDLRAFNLRLAPIVFFN